MADAVPAAEFARNFGQYQAQARREAVAVSTDGHIAGYVIGPEEYEAYLRYRDGRRSFATADLPQEAMDRIAATRVEARHAHLDALLDTE